LSRHKIIMGIKLLTFASSPTFYLTLFQFCCAVCQAALQWFFLSVID